MIVNKTYRRKTFKVQAIQVTLENMRGVAEWCGGEISIYWPTFDRFSKEYTEGRQCIEVVVGRINGRPKRARAYIGDWITRSGEKDDFRVYQPKDFEFAFEEVRSDAEKHATLLDTLSEFLVSREMSMNQAEVDAAFDQAAKDIAAIFA